MGRLLLDKKLTLSKNIIYPYTLYTYEEANAFIMLADIIDRAVAQDIVSGEMAHKWHKELILNSKQGLFAMQVNFIITITNK
jgi:hypothetical protein